MIDWPGGWGGGEKLGTVKRYEGTQGLQGSYSTDGSGMEGVPVIVR